jgi:hypothetical protein
MEAAPYDLRALGYAPIPVETPDGRAEYVRRQKLLVEQASPLRARVADALSAGLRAVDAVSCWG